MGRGGSSDDSDDDEEPRKRRRVDGFGTEADPNMELDAMLAAASGMAPPGMNFSGVLGADGAPLGKGADFGKGADLSKGLGKGLDLGKGGPELSMEPRIQTTPMDFSRLSEDARPSKSVPVSKDLVEYLMTPEHRQMLNEESGADVEWSPDSHEVQLRGSAEQIKKAQRMLTRVTTHCHWGKSEAKITRILQPPVVESVVVRLSPMNTLRPSEKVLSQGQRLSIGKDKINDTVIQDAVVSRQHCVVELDSERGAVYVLDCSTNGTFLNGRRLPAKSAGKVLLSHGDELLLKDPSSGDSEYGYIVNLNELHVKAAVKLEGPRRILTQDEISGTMRDFV